MINSSTPVTANPISGIYENDNNQVEEQPSDNPVIIFQRIFAKEYNEEDALIAHEKAYSLITEACEQKNWQILHTFKEKISALMQTADKSVILNLVERDKGALIKEIEAQNLYSALVGKDKNRIVHAVVETGQIDLLPLFSARGLASMNALDSKKANLLFTAIKSKQKAAIETCLKVGNKHNQYFVEHTFRLNALSLIVYEGYIEGLEQLIKTLKEIRQIQSLNFSQNTDNLGNLLHVAIWAGQHQMLRHLLNEYSEKTSQLLEMGDHEGKTPLILAASVGDLTSLKILLQKGAEINQVDFSDQTAMHHAAKNGHRHVISFLKREGAEVSVLDCKQKPPIKYSCDKLTKNLLKNLYRAGFIEANDTSIDYLYCKPHQGIFQGGGAKGVAYVGVVQALEKLGLLDEMRRFAGTSAGSLLALFLALGMNSRQIEETMKNMLEDPELEKLLDLITFDLSEEDKKDLNAFAATIKKTGLGIKKIGLALVKSLTILAGQRTGWADGEELKNWLNRIIEKYTTVKDCTFGDLASLVERETKNGNTPLKHLHVLTTDLKTSSLLHINSEQEKWKNFLIADAVVASSAYPLLLTLQKMRERIDGELIVNDKYQCSDGGILANLPDEIFDRVEQKGWLDPETAIPQFNRRSIAFCFEQSQITPSGDTKSAYSFLVKVVTRVYTKSERMRKQIMPGMHESRLVRISNGGIKTTEFKADPNKIQAAIDAAYNSTLNFFEERKKYDEVFL